ncbi:MAG: type VI secretion system ATPase TssH [Gemmatimonadaceae bacterium]
MLTKDPRRLLAKLDPRLMEWLENAIRFASVRTHYEVSLEHLLVKMLEDGSGDIPRILRHFGISDTDSWDALLLRLEQFRTGSAGRPTVSPTLLQLMEEAWLIASLYHGQVEVRSANLLEAMLAAPALRLEPYMLSIVALSEDDLRARYHEILDGSSETPAATTAGNAVQAEGKAGVDVAEGDARETALARYTLDLTARARAGEIDPVFGRDVEIRQIIDILSRRRKNNPVLVGEAGVGKTAVVEGLAMRIAHGDVPESLSSVAIHSLDLGLLQAGAGVKGEFENRLKSVIREVRESPRPIVLFIDEAHTLIGAGGAAGTSDAANLLKPALARGELRTIAATTWSEYKKYFERDAALERRFQPVKIEEPSIEVATTILRGIKAIYERHHHVQIPDDAVSATVKLAARFISGRQLPDKAVDLLDTACARVRMAQTTKPPSLDDLERRILDLDTRIAAVERDSVTGLLADEHTVVPLRQKREELLAQCVVLNDRWKAESALAQRIIDLREQLGRQSGNGTDGDLMSLMHLRGELAALQGDTPMVPVTVDASTAAQVVADWTGIPVGAMLKDDAARILDLETHLRPRVLGQEEAIGELADLLRIGKAGIANPDAPLGVFLLIGPSGVGKTECARAIAELLFGGERFLVTINMSEYQEPHTVAQLKGSPPGYVGYGEGGVLTEAVRQRPYSVVLLDEVEKAHGDVMNLFYQVFDKGFMRDGEGREIDFKNTVIMLTSNVGADEFHEACAGDDGRPDPDTMREMARLLLLQRFAPALLGRMRIVPFYPLDGATMQSIVRLKLDRVAERIRQAHDVALVYDESVVEWIVARCTEVEAGARNVDAIIDRSILPQASRALLFRPADDAASDILTLGLGEGGALTYTFSDFAAVPNVDEYVPLVEASSPIAEYAVHT